MTGQDVLADPSNSHFGFVAHCRDGVIFHPHILCNDCYHGLHDDDDWTVKSFGTDSSASSHTASSKYGNMTDWSFNDWVCAPLPT